MSNHAFWKGLSAVVMMGAVLLFFLSPIFRSPGDFIFSSDGDGLQTYYQSVYHVKYDTSSFHQQSMNAPFGESIFFTGGQPLLSNVLKGLLGSSCSSYTVIAWTNLLMMLSPLLCALFLYLLFNRFRIPWYYAVFAAVGVTMLTQQWDRFLGHYPLAYLYAVPGMLWGLMRWSDKPDVARSAWNAAYVFLLASLHLYYLFFFAVLAGAMWCSHFPWRNATWRSRFKPTLDLALQVIIPFVLLQLIISSTSDVVDRTAIPWGFTVYRSYWQSYLWPSGMWYESALSFLRGKNPLEWEGMSYIGLGAILLLLSWPWLRLKEGAPIQRMDNRAFIRGLWIAVLCCVLLSFTFPFNLGLEALLYKLGPVQQFRGIGRFAWVAFYPLLVVLMIQWFGAKQTWSWKGHAWAIVIIGLIWMDGVQRISQVSARMIHGREELLSEGAVPIDATAYAAMLPLPCFQIGSENVGSDAPGALKSACYDLSAKTGLPMIAASMSRTSLSQTFQNLALTQPLFHFPEVLNTWRERDGRPFLLLVDPSIKHRYHEQLLIDHSDSVATWHGFTCRRLPWDAWSTIHATMQKRRAQVDPAAYNDGVWVDSTQWMLNDMSSKTLRFNHSWSRVGEYPIPETWWGDSVIVQMEVSDFTRDLIPRTFVEMVQMNGESLVRYESEMLGKRYVYADQGTSIVQYPMRIRNEARTLRISAENKLIQGDTLRLKNLIIFRIQDR